MKPKFACADFTFPLLRHDQALKLINMIGFEGVDIGLFEGRSHLQPSSQFPKLEENAKILLGQLEALDLKAADVFLQCDNNFSMYPFNHPEKERREFAKDWFLKTLEFASALNGHHVTILPGVEISGDYERDFALAVTELQWCADKAKEHGIVLGTEAHVGSLVQYPAQAARLIDAVDGLTLTLDFTHFVRLGVDEKEYLPLLKYARHFHARNASPGDIQVVASENTIDYEKVVKQMVEVHYQDYVGIEFFWSEWEKGNRVDNVSESILLRNFIAEKLDQFSNKYRR